jgi:hypothetical protein
MQFLANENMPYPSIEILRDKGYEIISIYEDLPGIDDQKVLTKAVSGKQKYLLPNDRLLI